MNREDAKAVLKRAIEAGYFGEVRDGGWETPVANMALGLNHNDVTDDEILDACVTEVRGMLAKAADLVGRPLDFDEAQALLSIRVYADVGGPLGQTSNGLAALRVAYGLPRDEWWKQFERRRR